MAVSTALQLRSESGAIAQASGEWRRYDVSERALRAGGLAVGGVLAATVCLFVPVLHLLTTWLLPLLGAVAAWNAWRTRERIRAISGTCPACTASVHLDGGRYQSGLRDACPACRRILFVERSGAAAETP